MGGYGITRNGMGRGLANFSGADWTTTQSGIAFVDPDQSSFAQGSTTTQIPTEGLALLCFQVRWLDKSPDEPVVWRMRLVVEPEGEKEPKKWEEYQSALLARLEPASRAAGERSGDIKPGKVTVASRPIVYKGSYSEVPVMELQSIENVMTGLVEPAIAERS